MFGLIPDFYVAYDHDAVPLYGKGWEIPQLALKASTDPVFIAANALVAGAQQAGDTPNYGQGARGYGQRFGASYANGFTAHHGGRAPSCRRFSIRIHAYFLSSEPEQRNRELFMRFIEPVSFARATTEMGAKLLHALGEHPWLRAPFQISTILNRIAAPGLCLRMR